MTDAFEEVAKNIILDVLQKRRGETMRMNRRNLKLTVNYRLMSVSEKSISDRTLRKYIEDLRTTKEGCMICASLKGGYFLARNRKELDKFTASDENRGIKIINRVRKQRRAAGLLVFPPQLELEI